MAIPATVLGMNVEAASRALARTVTHAREEKAFRFSRLAVARRPEDIEAANSPKKVRLR